MNRNDDIKAKAREAGQVFVMIGNLLTFLWKNALPLFHAWWLSWAGLVYWVAQTSGTGAGIQLFLLGFCGTGCVLGLPLGLFFLIVHYLSTIVPILERWISYWFRRLWRKIQQDMTKAATDAKKQIQKATKAVQKVTKKLKLQEAMGEPLGASTEMVESELMGTLESLQLALDGWVE